MCVILTLYLFRLYEKIPPLCFYLLNCEHVDWMYEDFDLNPFSRDQDHPI